MGLHRGVQCDIPVSPLSCIVKRLMFADRVVQGAAGRWIFVYTEKGVASNEKQSFPDREGLGSGSKEDQEQPQCGSKNCIPFSVRC